MTKHAPTTAELYRRPASRAVLRALYGGEFPPRVAHLEGKMAQLLEAELPNADPEVRREWAHHLAVVVAFDPWFERIGRDVTPARVSGALARAKRAARELQAALDALPDVAAHSVHRRLLELDVPDPQTARRTFLAGSVLEAVGKGPAGLPARRRMLAELVFVASNARENWRSTPAGKYRANRLARHVADAYEALVGEPAPVGGSGEGPFYRLLATVLNAADLRDASVLDVGRREAKRRRAALHSGKIRR